MLLKSLIFGLFILNANFLVLGAKENVVVVPTDKDANTTEGKPDKDPISTTAVWDFPNNNFSIFNVGEKTVARINLTNLGDSDLTVYQVMGSLASPSDEKNIIRNLTATRLKLVIKPTKTASILYRFVPDFDLPDVTFLVYLDVYNRDENAFRIQALKTPIKLVYNDSIFDLQNLSIYLLGLALVAGSVYYLYQSLLASIAAPAAGPTTTKKSTKSATIAAISPENLAAPDMDWIPEHVKLQQKQSASPRIKKRK